MKDGIEYGCGHMHDVIWIVWCWLFLREGWNVSRVRFGVPDCCGTMRGQHMVNESVPLFGVCDTLYYSPA